GLGRLLVRREPARPEPLRRGALRPRRRSPRSRPRDHRSVPQSHLVAERIRPPSRRVRLRQGRPDRRQGKPFQPADNLGRRPSQARDLLGAHTMRRAFPILILLLLAFGASVQAAPVKVVTTLPAYASIAQFLGGDRVQAQSISRGDEDAHFVKPKPSFALMLKQ